MKVLHIGKYYPPDLGGIETVVRSLSEGLAKGGDQVTVLCASSSAKGSIENREGVRVIRVPSYGTLFSQPIAPGLFNAAIRLARQSDVVHVHTPHPLAEAAVSMIPRPIRVVVTYHSDVIRQRWARAIHRPILRGLLRRADRIVVPTEEHIDFSDTLGEFREKCSVIPFGLDAGEYHLTEEVRREAVKLKQEHGPYALFVGRLVSYKGLDVLVRAFHSLPKNRNIKMLVVGTGPLEQRLRQQIEALGLSDQVKLIGSIKDQTRFLAYFYGSEFFVLPSITRNEAFGMVLLEAMACGKPLISTSLESGVRFVNQDQVTGIQVSPGSAEELAQAINTLSSSAELREKMGLAASERFSKIFRLDHSIDAHRSLYEELR